MRKINYICDRKGCTSTTEVVGDYPFAYGDISWVGMHIILDGEATAKDFCALECAGMWIDDQIEKKRGGKKG